MTNRRPPLVDLASEKVFNLARSWLKTCEENHPKCSENDFIPILPTYIIDVCPVLQGVATRLHKSKEGEEAKYLCLSYCWGTKKQATTTHVNLEEYLQEIPVGKLGLTIQDAIEVTRRLGFRYLWVDALCIVQDDDEQKADEIRMMSHTYKNATAVISAATASASSEGFLRTDRDVEVVRSLMESKSKGFEFQVELPGGSVGNFALVKEAMYPGNHPLDCRAWALQEHLLSTRQLVFSFNELLVRYREPVLLPLRKSFISYGMTAYSIVDSISTWNWDNFTCTNLWGELIWKYSRRMLTDPEDRLHAFEGIAKEIEEVSGTTTRYGIPAFDCATIAWEALGPVPVRSPRAPSWSWACLDTVVLGPNYNAKDISPLYKAEIRFNGDDDSEKLVVTACIIDGAAWTGKHPDTNVKSDCVGGVETPCHSLPDLKVGFPKPCYRRYLLAILLHSGKETVLILESAGPNVYRRTGVYKGYLFRDSWPTERREMILI
jgi:hypothetical protein